MKQALENATDADRAALDAMLARPQRAARVPRARARTPPSSSTTSWPSTATTSPSGPAASTSCSTPSPQRAAAAQRLRNSMTPEQRAELDALAQQAFGSPELMESARPARRAACARCGPGEDWGGSERMDGENGPRPRRRHRRLPGPRRPRRAGRAARAVRTTAPGSTTSTSSGSRASSATTRSVDARTLQRLEKALRDSGTMRRGSDGRLALTPKAMRQLGKSAPARVAESMSGPPGRARRPAGRRRGRAAPGRRAAVGVRRHRAVGRDPDDHQRPDPARPATRPAPRPACAIEIGDVEVQETEARTQACVALLVDTSFSMAMEGRWVPMKRTALALHTLVTSRFRGDDLQLIALRAVTRRSCTIEQLVGLDAQWDKGTNLHHALLLANRHFRKHPNAQPVLLIVTDGEPTSHLEPDGEVVLRLPAGPGDDRPRGARARRRHAPGRPHHVLPARRRPGPRPLRRLDGPAGGRHRGGPGGGRPRRRRRRLVPGRAAQRCLRRPGAPATSRPAQRPGHAPACPVGSGSRDRPPSAARTAATARPACRRAGRGTAVASSRSQRVASAISSAGEQLGQRRAESPVEAERTRSTPASSSRSAARRPSPTAPCAACARRGR